VNLKMANDTVKIKAHVVGGWNCAQLLPRELEPAQAIRRARIEDRHVSRIANPVYGPAWPTHCRDRTMRYLAPETELPTLSSPSSASCQRPSSGTIDSGIPTTR